MSFLRFEWDLRKAAANRQKHGVSFEDAQSVFADERARLIDDPIIRRTKAVFFCLT